MGREDFALAEGHYHFHTNAKTILSSRAELSSLNLTCVSHLGKLGLEKKGGRKIHFKCSMLSLSACTQFVLSHSDRN